MVHTANPVAGGRLCKEKKSSELAKRYKTGINMFILKFFSFFLKFYPLSWACAKKGSGDINWLSVKMGVIANWKQSLSVPV